MPGEATVVREFLGQLERTLVTRRLYGASAAPSQDAHRRLLERCRAATGGDALTLRFTATEVFLEKTLVLSRPSSDECFTFPLYRDGLRELTILASITEEELGAFLSIFESDDRKVRQPDEDVVSYLWRLDLQHVRYTALDAIGEDDGGGEGADVRQGLESLAEALAEKIQRCPEPAAPAEVRPYALVIDATVHVGATDLHYDATTRRRSFGEAPPVLSLTPEEAEGLRAEVARDDEADLLRRFVEALFAILSEPVRPMAGPALASLFQRLLAGYWSAADYGSLLAVLRRLRHAGESVPNPENRAAARHLIVDFFTGERLREVFDAVLRSRLALDAAAEIWEHVGESAWDGLVEFAGEVPDGPVRRRILLLLQRLFVPNPDLLRRALRDGEPGRVRIALMLVEEHLEPLFAPELLALATHRDEGIRIKGLHAAGRIGTRAAREALWRAAEGDPVKAVRLVAFRLIGLGDQLPNLPRRLKALVKSREFHARPLWERDKYVRLLADLEGESVRPLFENWVDPNRRSWFSFRRADPEKVELGLRGMVCCGRIGAKRVQAVAAQGGRLATLARKVLSAMPRELEASLARSEDARPRAAELELSLVATCQ